MLLDMRVVSVRSHTFFRQFFPSQQQFTHKKSVIYHSPLYSQCFRAKIYLHIWEETYNKVFFSSLSTEQSKWLVLSNMWTSAFRCQHPHVHESLTHKHVSLPVGTAALGRAVCQLARLRMFSFFGLESGLFLSAVSEEAPGTDSTALAPDANSHSPLDFTDI